MVRPHSETRNHSVEKGSRGGGFWWGYWQACLRPASAGRKFVLAQTDISSTAEHLRLALGARGIQFLAAGDLARRSKAKRYSHWRGGFRCGPGAVIGRVQNDTRNECGNLRINFRLGERFRHAVRVSEKQAASLF